MRIIFRWTRIEKERELLEKEKIKSELAFLRNQVSPHFFMNTMNNIHALIAIDPRKAQNSVMQLSKMMSYLLYNTNEGYTKLSQEIEFIKSYTKLMKLRYSSKVAINLNFPDEIPEVNIPPLLFTALVENAFKHGVSYISESFVDLVMQIDNHQLYFMLRNSKTRNIKGTHQPGGLGLENLKKRLELLFQEQYELIISEDQNTFEITIKIPLYA